MNKKSLLISGLLVFVVSQVLDFITHGMMMGAAYEATSQLWRPEQEMVSMMWVIYAVGLLSAFIFVYIFDQMRTGPGFVEGIKFGSCIGLFMAAPMAFNSWAVMPLPYSMAASWFVYGMIKFMICGVVVSLVHKPDPAAS